ncbi:DUF2141 domain-containing protein [Sphingomonas sp.]|uniref:DUF2141 domain-containing protein n=1 Tax=Sphingomonas sp. TaxID=28214 RepID=UPI001DC37605|nr:DUF2141 domain-containing protein [Sphingomonas sp.]MBX9797758.1 DUF2141 domain-containing protein [Sphingomonas sp.]
MRRAVMPVLLAALSLAAPAAGDARARAIAGGDAAACELQQGPAVEVHITGLKDRKGRLKLELYPGTEEDFLKDDRDLVAQGKFFRRIWAETPATGDVVLCIKAPHAGRYGLFFTHDRDGKNKFSVWNDGAGIVSNKRLGSSKPRLAASDIVLGEGVAVITIRAQYLRGIFSGFGPLKDS